MRSLQAVGVELVPQSVPVPVLFGRTVLGNDFEMAITIAPGPDRDPDTLRQLFSSKAPKVLGSAKGYVNPEFDDLAQRQLTTLDVAERKRLVARMQEILARDLPSLPLYYETFFHIFKKDVFDQWYWTPGDFPVGVYNKQALVTGQKTGVAIRPSI